MGSGIAICMKACGALLCFFLFAHEGAAAGFLEFEPKIETVQATLHIRPNEIQPEMMIPLLKGAPAGAIVSVGAERGFIATSLAPHLEQIFLVDVNQGVQLYNLINIELLKANANAESFRQAKLRPGMEFFQKVADCPRLGLTAAQLMAFWEDHVPHETRLRMLMRGAPYHRARMPFPREANYHINENLYQRLRRLALQDRIRVFNLDLRSKSEVQNFVEAMLIDKIRLSVIDLSNAHEELYIGQFRTNRLLREFAKVAVDRAFWILVSGFPTAWTYRAALFESLAEISNPVRQTLIRSRTQHCSAFLM